MIFLPLDKRPRQESLSLSLFPLPGVVWIVSVCAAWHVLHPGIGKRTTVAEESRDQCEHVTDPNPKTDVASLQVGLQKAEGSLDAMSYLASAV